MMRIANITALVAVMEIAAAPGTQDIVDPPQGTEIRRPPFVFKTPPTINLKPLHAKDTLIEGDLAWTYTGVLAKPLDLHRGIYGTTTLPAGEKYYGVPLASSGMTASRLSWCSPKPDADGKFWSATCVIAIDGGYVLQRPTYPPFTLTAIGLPRLVGPNATDIVMSEQPVEFGVTVHIEYLVHKFSDTVLLLDKRISVPGYKTITYPNLRARVGRDGATLVLVGGALIRLSHIDSDSYQAQVLSGPVPGSSISAVGAGIN